MWLQINYFPLCVSKCWFPDCPLVGHFHGDFFSHGDEHLHQWSYNVINPSFFNTSGNIILVFMYGNKGGTKLSCFVVKFVGNSQNLLFSPADIIICNLTARHSVPGSCQVFIERKTFWFLVSTGWFGETAHVNTGVKSEAKKQTCNRPFSHGFTPQNWVVKRAILRKTHWEEDKRSINYKMTCAVGGDCDRIKYFGEVYNLCYPPTHLPTEKKPTKP